MAADASSGDVALNYEVFISFRGADTREGFTNTLFDFLKSRGIETFIDDGLPSGQIETSLVKTIKSRIAVVVFSKNYASSSRCLDELVKMREFNLKIMPIFYDVKPEHVSELSGEFGKEFAKLKSTENEVKIKDWSNDLAFAASQDGWVLDNYSKEIDLIKEVTDYILNYLDSDFVSTRSSEIIGIDSLVNELQTLLTNGSSGVKFLGLWGMGGIGKTTIAEVLYHRLSQQFGDRYFCSLPLDVKDACKLVDLRNEMISHFFRETLDEGTPSQPPAHVLSRLQEKKVLIVLDNVITSDQVTTLVGSKANPWFAFGSKIIVTSRDFKVLKNEGMEVREIKEMSRDDSLILFCSHAFKQNRPLDDENYVRFSNTMVDYTKGLPLALKVLGRELYERTKEEWRSTLKTLETRMDPNIEAVLRISYSNLSKIEKEIFLDIVCSFKEYDKDWVKDLLDGYGIKVFIGIDHLIEKCLVTLNPDNTLGIHNLIQKMGQNIIEEQSRLGIRTSFDRYNLVGNYQMTTLERFFPISNVILETLSAAFEQLSSPQKPYFALIGMLISFFTLIICIIELIYKGKLAKVTWKTKRFAIIIITGWFYHPPPHDQKPFGSFVDVVGLICAIFQLIFSAVQWAYVISHRDYPVKISMFPIIFAMCLAWSRLMKKNKEHAHTD